MPIPYHGDTDYNIDNFDTGFNDDLAQQLVDDIFENLDTEEQEIDIAKLVGNKRLQDGGVLGDILELLRVHVDDMIARQELDRTSAGAMYSQLINTALTGSLEWIFKEAEFNQDDKKTTLDMVQQLYEIELAKMAVELGQQDRKLKIFDLEYMNPLKHESLVEEVENQHVIHQLTTSQLEGQIISNDTAKHTLDITLPKQDLLLDDNHASNEKELDIRDYYYNNVQPAEKLLLDDDHSAKAKELDIRSYYNSEMQPVEKSILDDEHCIKATDCETKKYYKDEIQPLEKDIAEEDELLKNKENDIKQYYIDNMQPVEKDTLVAQKELAEVEADIKEYYNENMQPVEKSILDDDHCIKSTECDTKKYYRDEMQPAEKQLLDDDHVTKAKQQVLLDDDHAAKEKELDIRSYYNENMQPVEKALLDDDHCIKTAECDTKKYYNDNMQPIEKLILEDEHCLKSTDCDIKKYYRDEIQPLEKDKLEEEIALMAEELELKRVEAELRAKELELAAKELEVKEYELENTIPSQVALTNAQACVQNQECAIKSYYRSYIQPYEKDLAHARAFQEEVNAGNYEVEDSMPAKKIEQMEIQNELYIRQKESYDDTKYQKLFDTQVNYAAMIFADRVEETPEVLKIGGGDAVTDTYNLLTPNQI